jgi:hypothetical protein
MTRFTRLASTLFGVVAVLIMTVATEPAWSQETGHFARLWPTLQQPWYFRSPAHIAIDHSGHIYVADSGNNRIQKFSADGVFITKWGALGEADGQFKSLTGIAVDHEGQVFVADSGNNRIQKFSADGTFLSKWGSYGSHDGQLANPTGLGVDNAGHVYVADRDNARVQKFTGQGVFITKWGSPGSGNGQFQQPSGLAVNSGGQIYVTDSLNDCVQKFSSTGDFLARWGDSGEGDGQFMSPDGIAVNRNGQVHVVDSGNDRGQEFSADGDFVSKWGSSGVGDGQLWSPSGVAVDENGRVYVADSGNDRIQKFSTDGGYMTQWGSNGAGSGFFRDPHGIAQDHSGNIYVADSGNHRVQKFNAEGRFLTTWGSQGDANGQFQAPRGLAVDGSGYVYVADSGNDRIQKFNPDGTFNTQWGSSGSDAGQFWNPHGVVVDLAGFVYVADTSNNRVQKFTGTGIFVAQWGIEGEDGGQFSAPEGIAVDGFNNVLVADTGNNRIQKFNPDGALITQWGELGTGDRQFSLPSGLAVDGAGNVYVADTYNDRVQKFSADGEFIARWGSLGSNPGLFYWPVGIVASNTGALYVLEAGNNRAQIFTAAAADTHNRAIIVAGGGPYPGNHLWDATQMCANFAYRALTYQGFTKESIYYLTSDTDLDLDGNGEPDDVDADATNANLQHAITEWAAGAENVVIYLVDHGGGDTFRMRANENLDSFDLAFWLDALQDSVTGKVIIIYDACQSGSFLSMLSSSAGQGRIVIASATADEKAYFLSQGAISFSNYFWTQIFNGLKVRDAFEAAQQAVQYTTHGYPDPQNPLLDDNGDGEGNNGDGDLAGLTSIGNGSNNYFQAPTILGVSPEQTINDTTTATLTAEIAAQDLPNLSRVWAVVRPPAYVPGPSGNPVGQLPTVDLMPVQPGSAHFEAAYDGFTREGTYPVAIYARDRSGNTCIPKLTSVNVNTPLTRKAIIVAGFSASPQISAGIQQGVRTAYNAVHCQGYGDNDIVLLSSTPVPGVDHVFEPAVLANLISAIESWAADKTQDVVLYLVGEGEAGAFKLSPTEKLLPTTLQASLNTLQANLPGKIVVVYDGSYSGGFLPSLVTPTGKERILVSSAGAGQAARFLSGGYLSFSQFFWTRVANGATVLRAFLDSQNALRSTCPGQEPQLDDNGNGIANENTDAGLARYYALGMGMMIAADPAVIGATCSSILLRGESSATLWTGNITSSKAIKRVFATIMPPGLSSTSSSQEGMDTVELIDDGNGRYFGTYRNFSRTGKYAVSFFALDGDDSLSYPVTISVTQPAFDLTVPKVAGPASAKRGQAIKLTISVKNQGVQPVGPFTVGIYLSPDTRIDAKRDRLLKSVKVKKLAAGAAATISTRTKVPSNLAPGTYYLGVAADIQNSVVETKEANNAKASKRKLVIQ